MFFIVTCTLNLNYKEKPLQPTCKEGLASGPGSGYKAGRCSYRSASAHARHIGNESSWEPRLRTFGPTARQQAVLVRERDLSVRG